jgi:GGDEF domain-containing protein
MSLEESIERLERLIAEVRQASLTDDKTTLGSALALRQEENLINEGTSEFGVVVFGDLNNFKQLNMITHMKPETLLSIQWVKPYIRSSLKICMPKHSAKAVMNS